MDKKYTKSKIVAEAATEAVWSEGVSKLDALTGRERRAALVALYQRVMNATGCSLVTARRHVAQELRRSRGVDVALGGCGNVAQPDAAAPQRTICVSVTGAEHAALHAHAAARGMTVSGFTRMLWRCAMANTAGVE